MLVLPFFLASVLLVVAADDAAQVKADDAALVVKTPPPQCKENEYFIDGGPNCQQTCENLFKVCNVNHVAPVRECFCMPGFARNKKGVCKPLWDKECFCEINFKQMLSTYFSHCFGRL